MVRGDPLRRGRLRFFPCDGVRPSLGNSETIWLTAVSDCQNATSAGRRISWHRAFGKADRTRSGLSYRTLPVRRACEDHREASLRWLDGLRWPWRLVRVASPEYGAQRGLRLICTDDRTEAGGQWHDARKLCVAAVAMTEAPRSVSAQIAEPEIGNANPGADVEQVERLLPGQIVGMCRARERSVFPPLHIDCDRTFSTPIRVQDRSVPIRPYVDRCHRCVVGDPDDFSVSRFGEREPGAMCIVAPQQVICDDGACRMYYGNHALEREWFIVLQIQCRRECAREHRAGIIRRDARRNHAWYQRNFGAWPARRRRKCDSEERKTSVSAQASTPL
jgi:hypothetical protein